MSKNQFEKTGDRDGELLAVGEKVLTFTQIDVPTRGMAEELEYLLLVMPPTLPPLQPGESVLKPGA